MRQAELEKAMGSWKQRVEQCSLKMEKDAKNQGMQAAFRCWKRQENRFPLEPPERMQS